MSAANAAPGPRIREKHDLARPGNLYLAARRWNLILAALGRMDHALATGPFLEVGCGSAEGLALVALAGLRFLPVVGVDLFLYPGAQARAARQGASLMRADGAALPFSPGVFAVTAQCMLLSSVLSLQNRLAVAREMVRVTRPGGIILSLDLRYPGPPGAGRTTLGLRSVRKLFPHLRLQYSTSHIILPPVARLLRGSPWICDLLAKLPVLRAYRLAVFRKSDSW